MRALAAPVAVLLVTLLVASPGGSAASVDRPTWTPGDSWTYRTNTTLTPGLNLTGAATSTVSGTQATVVAGSVLDAFRVVLSGSGTAAGTVSTPSGNVSVQGRWIVTGEERFEPTNLHPIYSLLDLSVNGTYLNLVPFSIRVQNTTTFQVLTDGWAYPWPVGGSGSVSLEYNFTQDVYAIGGGALHDNGTGRWNLGFSLGAPVPLVTPAGSFTAYPLVETRPDGSSERSWYAPAAGNNVRTETFDANGSLTSETTLVSYRYQALETPTFLGLTLLEWGVVLPAAAVAAAAVLLLRRRSRRKKPRPAEGDESSPEVTSGPRGP